MTAFEKKRPPRVPRATYRFQFHHGFTLRMGTELLPHLAFLGVSHVYASPLLKAMPGSGHGYDVCDPTCINPDLGSEEDLEALVGSLHRYGMDLVLDIVPNHMGIGGRENLWWWDVLKNGEQSRFAKVFDVDWQSPDPALRGKVLMPVLGTGCLEALSKGELRLVSDAEEPVLRYFEHEFPLAADSLPPLRGTPAERRDAMRALNGNPDALAAILDRQHYRLVDWHRGDSELNYRRFFTITSLAGVRVEDPEVFRMTHERILLWYERGWIDGFRVDHPDGLRDPEEYLQRLRHAAPDAWIIVEKILTGEERLPDEWPVAGTTGYDFLNRVTRLQIDPDGEAALTNLYANFSGQSGAFEDLAHDAKREVLRHSLAAEVSRLLRLLESIAVEEGVGSDDIEAWRESLIEFIACFPVYRTYVRPGLAAVRDVDRSTIRQASDLAKLRLGCSAEMVDAVQRVLTGNFDHRFAAEFTARFQQLTGPAMAKGVEDCAFYRYNRFVALNEVGGEPDHFGGGPDEFHQECIESIPRGSASMLATATHDTKRGEDVRARLCLLSEIPDEWGRAVRAWSTLNEVHRRGRWPDRNAEYLFYQTVVGAWPVSVERVRDYMEKAVREAGQYTAWTRIDPDYETSLLEFVSACLGDDRFVKEVDAFVAPLIEPGYVNSLAMTLLKLTTPGVPDVYQGCDLWDFSLVDPDNRRPVDFATHLRLAEKIEDLSPEVLWARRAEGLPKLRTIHTALNVRRTRPELFENATYEPVQARGAKSAHALAFMRNSDVLVIVPRLVVKLARNWEDTRLHVPDGEWHNPLTGDTLTGGLHPLASLLSRFPVALLVRQPRKS